MTNLLLNPKKYRDRGYPDERSKEIMLKTIDWFEEKAWPSRKSSITIGNLPKTSGSS